MLQLQQQGVQQRQQDVQQQRRQDSQQQDVAEVAESLLMLQCSKAMALGFILGPSNTYSTAAAAALQAASSHPAAATSTGAAAAAAETTAEDLGLQQSQDEAGSSGRSLLQAAAEAG
jgi:hypothetical protein